MIKNLSPYYKTIPWISPATGLTCTSFTLNIYVWDGLKTSPPIAPHYSITKNNVTDSDGSDKINIARLVSDYIDFSPLFPGTATTLNRGNNQAWVKTEVFYNLNKVPLMGSPEY